ncbi:two-component system regulatory protein YycI [Planococcus chinensis]|uniref:Two-component system regulatory protein YycI n=1 Tax=Planococcus chinensis TaxID=272917 RepID=A0ABW4QIP7_9BACL
MDWNKTKSIFIIVFSILNVFLYSLYLDRYNESQEYDFLVDPTNEEKLSADDITYDELPKNVEDQPYVTGKVKSFVAADVPGVDLKENIQEESFLSVKFTEPLPLDGKVSTETLEEFVAKTVYQGKNYSVWKIDEKERQAVFFQNINDKPLYYSERGKLTLYWNEESEVTNYEQTIFDEIELSEQQKKLVPAIQAVHTLYQKRMLPTGTHIDSAEIGYTEYVTVSEGTQMFVPTWRIQATLEDGTEKEFFVNAVKGDVIELKGKTESEVTP